MLAKTMISMSILLDYFTCHIYVIDCHAMHLLLFKESELAILEIVQNKAKRIILGAPKATIVNMRTELNLLSVYEITSHIHTHIPHLVPSQLVNPSTVESSKDNYSIE